MSYQARARGTYSGRSRYQGRGRGNPRYRNYKTERQTKNNEDQSDDKSNDTSSNDDDNDNSNANISYNNSDDSSDNDENNDNSDNDDDDDDDDDDSENDDSKNEDDSDEEEDEYVQLKKGDDEFHSAAPDKSYKSIDHTPARSTIDPSFKCKQVHPFIEAFIKSYNENSSYLPDFYTDDAAFSLTFKKMPRNSEVAMLFEDNRNLFFTPRTQPIIGGQAILDFLKLKFKQGSNIVENVEKRRIQIVSNLFFAVNIYGTMNIYKDENDMKTVNFAKSLVVIGRNGKLLISNDHLAICM